MTSRRVRFEVYDQANPDVLVTTLTTDSDRSWEELMNEPGTGSVTVGADDPQAGDLDCRNHVRCLLDGVERFAWIIEERERKTIPRDGKQSSKTLTASGRGVLALLEYATLFPERLYQSGLSPATRLFNFASFDYTEDAAWHAAVQIKQQSAVTGQWDGAPLDWPDETAFWIWGRTQSTSSPPQPVGRCYFRKLFTLASQKSVKIFITSDDGFELYLDGSLVAQETKAFMWAETKEVSVFLDSGQHLLAIVGINIHRDSAATNVAGVIVSVVEVTEGGESYGAVVVNTDSTWSALDYPATPPVMTPGEIWRVLLAEAQERGALLGVTLGCTDDLDSNGVTWNLPADLEFRVGTTYLQILQTMIEMAIDARMSPRLQLDVYNRGTLGSNLTATTALEEGVHLSELSHRSECAIMNMALVSLHVGPIGLANDITGSAFATGGDGPSIAANGRLEAYLELGTAASTAQAAYTLQALFDEHASEQVTVSFQAEERVSGGFATDERPYVGWQPGDVVLAPGMDDLLTETTVLSIAVSDDPEGGPDPIFRCEGTQTPIVGS